MADQTTGTDNSSTPSTGDSGFLYSSGLLDIFKTGIGAYERIQTSQFEAKNRYDALNGQLFQNGQVANPLLATGSSSLMPLLLIGGLVVVAVLFISK